MELKNEALMEDESLQREMVRLAKRSRFKHRLVSVILVVLVILAAIAASWLSGRSQAKVDAQEEIERLKTEIQEQKEQIKELNESPMVVSPVAPRINLEVIRSEISNIAELATTEYLFTDAAEFSDSKQIKNWNIPLTKKSFVLKWSGIIKAGVDLKNVAIDVDEDEKSIVVSVPSATILSYTVDSDSVEVLDEKDNIFNNITIDDKVKFDAKTENAMKQRAIENGLLEKAQKNAEDILKLLIQADAAVGDNYTIEFVASK